MERQQSFKGYELDLTPQPMPSGRFAACARLQHQGTGQTKELVPDFEPFATEIEAIAAAQMAAIAWISHESGEAGASSTAQTPADQGGA